MKKLLPLAAIAAAAYTGRRGHRKPRGCEVEATDFMVESGWGDPEGGYRVQAFCDGQEVGETLVEVYPMNDVVAELSPRCRRNLSAQRRRHTLKTTSVARTAWTRLDKDRRRTGLGTAMYEEARTAAHKLGIPIAPDACFGEGTTSPAAWRVWNRKLAWEGQAARRGRRNVADRMFAIDPLLSDFAQNVNHNLANMFKMYSRMQAKRPAKLPRMLETFDKAFWVESDRGQKYLRELRKRDAQLASDVVREAAMWDRLKG